MLYKSVTFALTLLLHQTLQLLLKFLNDQSPEKNFFSE